jgi:type IV pilus assembly protein PilO
MADTNLTKLPLAGQLGISLLLAALIGGGFWYFWWSPKSEEEAQKRARLEALRADIRNLEVTANKLQDFQREVQQLEAKLETLKRILPPEKETPDLMKKVQYLAAQSNLNIKTFTPQATLNKDFYQEWPINVAVEGTYHNLGLFFDRVGRLSRLVNVGTLRISSLSRQTISSTITASCVATTFVFRDTAPAGAPARPPAPR